MIMEKRGEAHMNRAINSLLLKANRALGSRISDLAYVELDRLDEANEIFVGRMRQGELRQASLLRVLLFELQCLKEDQLIDYQLGTSNVGALPLRNYQVSENLLSTVVLDECIATWTVPVDLAGEVHCLATAYYLSDFVRQFWQKRLGSNLVWYVTPLADLDAFFEKRLEKAALDATEEAS